VADQNLITLREQARQAELSLARAKSKQDSAKEALTKVEQEIKDLGFDPSDKLLEKRITAMVEDAETLLASVQTDLTTIQEVLG
jgi:DNA-binding SARP family transcriptional activator